MADQDYSNLLDNPNPSSSKSASEMRIGNTNRIPGFLWICTKAKEGEYFVIPEDGHPTARASDDFFLEMKPEKVSVLLTDNQGTIIIEKEWLTSKLKTMNTAALKKVADTIEKVGKAKSGRGFDNSSGKNKRLKIKGKAGVWNSKKYDRPGEWFVNEVAKSGPLGGKAGGDPAKANPTTVQQEQVTLAIVEILMRPSGYDSKADYKEEFDKICTGFDGKGNKATGEMWYADKYNLGKIWKGLASVKGVPKRMKGIPGASYLNSQVDPPGNNARLRGWYYHFLLQFRDLEKDYVLGRKQGPWTVYTYDTFMDFISELVTAGPIEKTKDKLKIPAKWPPQINKSIRAKNWPKFGPIGQKDSWNPADIWLVNEDKIKPYIKKLKLANDIKTVNMALNEAYHKNVIIGISLKKGSAGSSDRGFDSKKLHYEEVNIAKTVDYADFERLADVKFTNWNFDLPWNARDKEFTKITSEILVTEMTVNDKGKYVANTKKRAKMRVGSGGQSKPHNINLEYGGVGAAAQLGKIPRDLIKKNKYLKDTISSIGFDNGYKLPSASDALKSIPVDEMNGKLVINKTKKMAMENKIKQIKTFTVAVGGMSGTGLTIKKSELSKFVAHIIEARMATKKKGKNIISKWEKDSDYIKNITMGIQMMEWAAILSRMHTTDPLKFNNFIQETYYLAQKKGEVSGSRFGPFTKLS